MKKTMEKPGNVAILTTLGIVAVSLIIILQFLEYAIQDLRLGLVLFTAVAVLIILSYVIGFITIVIFVTPIVLGRLTEKNKANK